MDEKSLSKSSNLNILDWSCYRTERSDWDCMLSFRSEDDDDDDEPERQIKAER